MAPSMSSYTFRLLSLQLYEGPGIQQRVNMLHELRAWITLAMICYKGHVTTRLAILIPVCVPMLQMAKPCIV
jgi:hypothetical protein